MLLACKSNNCYPLLVFFSSGGRIALRIGLTEGVGTRLLCPFLTSVDPTSLTNPSPSSYVSCMSFSISSITSLKASSFAAEARVGTAAGFLSSSCDCDGGGLRLPSSRDCDGGGSFRLSTRRRSPTETKDT